MYFLFILPLTWDSLCTQKLRHIVFNLVNNYFLNEKNQGNEWVEMVQSGFPDLGLSLGLISQLFTTRALGESVHTIDSEDLHSAHRQPSCPCQTMTEYQGDFLTDRRAVS